MTKKEFLALAETYSKFYFTKEEAKDFLKAAEEMSDEPQNYKWHASVMQRAVTYNDMFGKPPPDEDVPIICSPKDTVKNAIERAIETGVPIPEDWPFDDLKPGVLI
jgi:hypothetical protein